MPSYRSNLRQTGLCGSRRVHAVSRPRNRAAFPRLTVVVGWRGAGKGVSMQPVVQQERPFAVEAAAMTGGGILAGIALVT